MSENYNEHIGISLEQFTNKNKRLAHFVAQKYKTRMEYEDAVQLAFIGLTKAYINYDGQIGTKITTYAVPKMHGEIQNHLRNNSTQVKFPRVFKEIWGAVSKRGLDDETPEKIAEETGFELRFVKKAMEYYDKNAVISLNSQRYNNSQSEDADLTVEETIQSYQDFSSVFVNDFISTLDKRSQMILDMIMNKDMTQREIGDVVGVSQVQISRIIKKIIPLWEQYAS